MLIEIMMYLQMSYLQCINDACSVGPMNGVVSARAGSVAVCGGHGVQWMAWSAHVLAVWWCVVDMGSNGWRGQRTCWQCGGVWWTCGPMDGVVSARAGSVVVCGGHGVQ